MSLIRRNLMLALALVAGSPLLSSPALAQDKILRIVPHSNLAILDPIWTTAYMSRNHGYMIYDTLFGTDENAKIKPQMVESWTVSGDNRLWTFKLRKGLEFHDGKPVTGEDVIASLQRWGKRDAMGNALFQFVQRMDSPAPDTFRIFLGEACGFVLEALGKPSSNVPFIMPKRIAETDAFKQIEEHIGSGPYVFKKDEFKPGDKAVYLKNTKYVPRSEPPSGTTGGKHVYVDRVEWNLALRDAQAQGRVTLKLGHLANEQNVWHRASLHLAEQARTLSNGRIEVHPGWREHLHGYDAEGFDVIAAAEVGAEGALRLGLAALTAQVLGHLGACVVRNEVRAVNVVDMWWCHRGGVDWQEVSQWLARADARLTAPAVWLVDRVLAGVVPAALVDHELARLPRPAAALLRDASTDVVWRDPTTRTTVAWRRAFARSTVERARLVDQAVFAGRPRRPATLVARVRR